MAEGEIEEGNGRREGRDVMNENWVSWISGLPIPEAALPSMGTSQLLLLTGNIVTRMPKTKIHSGFHLT